MKKKCYICESNSLEETGIVTRDNPNIEVLICEHCGSYTLSKFSEIDYEKSEMRKDDKEQTIEEMLEAAKEDDKRRVSNNYFPFNNDTKILDFGAGAGGFLKYMSVLVGGKENLFGLEIENFTREHIINQGFKCFKNIEEIKKEGLKFDVITLWHVLEHLPDPKNVLKELKEILVDGGRIIMEVPNGEDVLLTEYHSKPFQDFTFWSCHLYTFNESSFSHIAKDVGYKFNSIRFVQRYPLVNHLHWLIFGLPGGHKNKSLSWLNDERLNREYEKVLTKNGISDTIIVEYKNV